MKIDDSAIPHLERLSASAKTKNKCLRFVRQGCSWHQQYKIVLDEQKSDDLVYCDRGFRIIVNKSLSYTLATKTIAYKKVLGGYKLNLK